jgi:hypothetical protein
MPMRRRWLQKALLLAGVWAVLLSSALAGEPPDKKSGRESGSDTLQPAERGRLEQERAGGLLEDRTDRAAPVVPVVPVVPLQTPPATNEKQTDDAIRRLGDSIAKQAKPEFICGPDVTRPVLAVLKRIRDEFQKADAKTQENACDALVSVKKTGQGALESGPLGAFAWDILELFNGSGAFPSKSYPNGVPSTWERMTNGECCTPNYPCGPTVEFFGACYNMQVVNYVMWGMTRNLCGKFYTINAQQSIAHAIRNKNSPNKPEQDVMVEVGEKYAEDLPKIEEPYKELEKSMLTADVKKLRDEGTSRPSNFPDLKDIVTKAAATSTSEYKKCATACTFRLPSMDFKFRWIGLTQPLPKDLHY